MIYRVHIRIAALLCMAALIASHAMASEKSGDPLFSSAGDPGIVAFENASADGKFLMVLFRKTDDPTPLSQAFDTVRDAMSDTLESVVVNTENPGEKGLVEQYNVRFAPLPMVVIVAPNGAITGNFGTPFTPEQVQTRFPSPVTQECLLAFQQRKLVFVCVQGKETSGNAEAMDGVTRFQQDSNMGSMASVVVIDPADPLEKGLLGQLRIDEQPAVAETLLMAPPGKVLGRWSGATSKETFTQALMALAKSQRTCSIKGCQDPSCPPPPAAQGGAE